MLFSNVFSDMFDDMFDMPTANQNAKGLMNCDVKEYDLITTSWIWIWPVSRRAISRPS